MKRFRNVSVQLFASEWKRAMGLARAMATHGPPERVDALEAMLDRVETIMEDTLCHMDTGAGIFIVEHTYGPRSGVDDQNQGGNAGASLPALARPSWYLKGMLADRVPPDAVGIEPGVTVYEATDTGERFEAKTQDGRLAWVKIAGDRL